MAVGVTDFPQTIDSATELLRAANLASSAIGVGGVNAVATTVPVTDTSSFPVDGVAWCGTEAISYTGKTSTTLTGCVRGFDATPAATHAAGDPIYGDIITSAHHEVLRDAIINLQTLLGTRANAATTGALRLDNAQWITARDSSDTVDLNLARIGPGNAVEIGPAIETTITAGTYAGLNGWFNIGAATPQNLGSIWSNAARLGFVFARKETVAGGAAAPTGALTSHLEMRDTVSDGVSFIADAVAAISNTSVWGANLIARSEVASNVKLVGLEVDVEPATGATVNASSGGIFLNVFNIDSVGPAILLGGVGGGTWSNGIVIDKIAAAGSGFAVAGSAATMATAINTANGTYGTAGVLFGAVNDVPSAIVRQSSVGSPAAAIFAVQNSAGSTNFMSVDASGNTAFKAKASTDLAVVFDTTTAARIAQFMVSDAGTPKWYIRKPADNTFDIYGAAAGALALTISTANLVNVPIFRATMAAGTTTAGTAPLKFAAGTLLTTPEVGAMEYTTDGFFFTGNTTNGRADDNSQQVYYLAADRTAIGNAIADYFATNSGIPYLANSVYEITYYLYYTKTTAGTVTYTFTTTTAPTRTKGWYVQTPVGGVGTVGTPQTAANKGTTATTLVLPATGSLTTAVDHRAEVKILIASNTTGNIRLRVTESAGTITPLADSYVTVRRIPSGGVGTFVA